MQMPVGVSGKCSHVHMHEQVLQLQLGCTGARSCHDMSTEHGTLEGVGVSDYVR